MSPCDMNSDGHLAVQLHARRRRRRLARSLVNCIKRGETGEMREGSARSEGDQLIGDRENGF